MLVKTWNILVAFTVILGLTALPAAAATAGTRAAGQDGQTYTAEEIVAKGHKVFGRTTKEVASVVEYAFRRHGEPNGYIVGEEGSGAIIGGLRYGEGTLFMKNGFRKKVYWQGPSIGVDFGGNGSRVLVLVYGLQHPDDLLARFAGIEGTAYVVGGLGVNFQQYANVTLAPIRTGLGFR
ncbi:MAG: EipA family protein, partial [Aestuariivirgaceae bacterium]